MKTIDSLTDSLEEATKYNYLWCNCVVSNEQLMYKGTQQSKLNGEAKYSIILGIFFFNSTE